MKSEKPFQLPLPHPAHKADSGAIRSNEADLIEAGLHCNSKIGFFARDLTFTINLVGI
ncbi:hypothetical protein VAEKB19_2310002 [Vibrio aestuarianus]|nr:hypothetical protein VAEKB19_2310002 [Vibrio aestuarianus]